MIEFIGKIRKKDTLLAAGLMSGTSMDGIDVALVRMRPEGAEGIELVAFDASPYPEELRATLRDLAFGEQCSGDDIATLHTSVAVSFANAFHTACHKAGVTEDDVDFIGSHGQTVAHVPPAPDGMNLIAGTLQMGPPAMIAAMTGVTTVGDFRSGDVALGGHGAPLAPFVDYLLRRSDERGRVILNIGGIANVTFLPKRCRPEDVIAFDTGPGNMIIDEIFRVMYPNEHDYDRRNAFTREGRASHELVDRFLGMAYFETPPPRSAGHREFGGRFAWEFLAQAENASVGKNDVLASAVSLTTRSIHDALRDHVQSKGQVDEVFVTGGGSRNPVIMEELTAMLSPVSVQPIDVLGIPGEAKEAVDFAVLAREAVFSRPNVLRHVTGSSRAAVLGTIAMGARQG